MDWWVLEGVWVGVSVVMWVFWGFVGSWVSVESGEFVGGWAGRWIGGYVLRVFSWVLMVG